MMRVDFKIVLVVLGEQLFYFLFFGIEVVVNDFRLGINDVLWFFVFYMDGNFVFYIDYYIGFFVNGVDLIGFFYCFIFFRVNVVDDLVVFFVYFYLIYYQFCFIVNWCIFNYLYLFVNSLCGVIVCQRIVCEGIFSDQFFIDFFEVVIGNVRVDVLKF